MQRSVSLVVFALAICFHHRLEAADARQTDNTFTLGTVTVTARRMPASAPPPQVIPMAEIERFDFRRLDEVLNAQPGLTLTPGGRGSGRAEDRIYLRGFDGLQVAFWWTACLSTCHGMVSRPIWRDSLRSILRLSRFPRVTYRSPRVRVRWVAQSIWSRAGRAKRSKAISRPTSIGTATLEQRATARGQTWADALETGTHTTQNTPRSFTSEYDDHAIGGSVVFGSSLGPGELTLAGHLREDDHEDIQISPARVPPTLKFEDRTWSVGAEYRWPLLTRVDAVVGVSHDSRDAERAQDQNRNGASFELKEQSATNIQAAVTWQLGSEASLHASVGRRSRFPSQFERYSYRLGSAIPNPDLALERATHYEVGYSGLISPGLSLESAAFTSELEELIQPVTVAPGVTQNDNVGKARYAGIELGTRWTPLPSLQAGLNYTYLDRESRSTPRRILFGTPDHAAFAYMSWSPSAPVELIPSVAYSSSRRTSDVVNAAGEPVDGFTLVNLRAIWRFSDQYSLAMSARNLTDENYALDYGYPREGRAYGISLTGEFQ